MLIPESILNSIGIAVVGAILTFLTGWFWRSRNQAIKKAETIAADHQAVLAGLPARVAALEEALKAKPV